MPELNKFQTIVERLMTDEEIREKAASMGLEEKVVTFIISQFDSARESMADDNGLTEDDMSRGEGRLGCYQSHEEVYQELAEVMDADIEWGDTDEGVDRVWEAFFDE